MHDIDTFMFFKWFFKAWVAVYLVTHTFTITMAVFDMAQHVVSGAAGVIGGNTNIDVDAALSSMQAGLDAMEIPELLLLVMETSLVSLCMKIMSVLITVILYGRMIEIYGYSWDGMFPLQQEAAERLFTQDGIEVFRIYEDGTEGAVTSLNDLQEHAEKDGLFGVEKETWEALHEYNAMKQQLRESEPTKEALLLYGKEDSYGIYQLARGEATRDLCFEPYDRLQATGHTVDRANYELIYTAPLTADITLNSIWEKFNIDHPKDFKGHSLSVSDIVVLHRSGENTAHYVDSIGFQNVPEFLQEKQSQLIPDEHLTGEQIRTPRGSFYVSDMSVEQMKEAGYGLHHQSDDGKYLIMGNGTRAFAVAAEQPEKANPLKHIEDTIEQYRLCTDPPGWQRYCLCLRGEFCSERREFFPHW